MLCVKGSGTNCTVVLLAQKRQNTERDIHENAAPE